jgi:hypothetical protein
MLESGNLTRDGCMLIAHIDLISVTTLPAQNTTPHDVAANGQGMKQ